MAKAKKNDIIELKAQLKENKLQKLYVFYGEEEYLKELYIKKIFDMVPDAGLEEFNRIVISGAADYEEYDNAWEGMPMMTDRRILMIRDSNIFTMTRKDGINPPNDEQKKFWTEKFKRLSDDTVVIFCEKNVDGRSALFKAAGKAGFTVKCEFMPLSDLKAWVIKNAIKAGKKIDDKTAEYLVSVIDPGLSNLEHELDKLISFCDEVIYKSDVDRVVSKAVGIKVFDITDGIMEGNTAKVFKIINDMKTQKESAFGTLYLIYSNVEKMLHLKLAGITNKNDAAKLLGGSPWIAGKYLAGASGFTTESLYHMVTRVPEIDFEIKSGEITEWQALEQYIAEALHASQRS
ncbi:MAG: DNA polymerase III subunit delta [Oscillospiraceae bacterium]|nr:DNA polymerase III subunit delta [Oscillospiraceae bacterium]